MKKVLLFTLLLGLSACSNSITGVTVHKNDIHALVEKNNACDISFKSKDTEKYSDIKTKFKCDKVKFFEETQSEAQQDSPVVKK
ncbi:hypothetical protein ACFX5K_01560 [Rickettsiales bacterium LUAb2]